MQTSGGMRREITMNKKLLLFLLTFFMLTFVSAQITYKADTTIDLIIVCLNDGYCSSNSYCNINIVDPLGDLIVSDTNMTYDTSFHFYEMDVNDTGKYFVMGFCADGEYFQEVDFNFDVTENGKPVANNISLFMIAIIFLIFFIACFFMFMSNKSEQSGFRIFFFLISIIFLMASLITGYMVASDGNISSNITSTTLSLVLVVGVILFIMFIIVLIKESVYAMDLLRIKQGKEWKVNPGMKMIGKRESIY